MGMNIFRLHHCQLCTIVIVLYLTLALTHSNSTMTMRLIYYMEKKPKGRRKGRKAGSVNGRRKKVEEKNFT